MCKRAIVIRNSSGGSYTSRKKALKYVASGRARYIDEKTIEMIEEDHRHLACVASLEQSAPKPTVQSPTIELSPTSPPSNNFRTFAPYPIDWEGYRLQAA